MIFNISLPRVDLQHFVYSCVKEYGERETRPSVLLRLRKIEQQQRRERQTSETEEQKEVRLQRMRITHSERMAVETEEQREARLQRMRTNQSDRLAAKTKAGCRGCVPIKVVQKL